LKNKSIAMLKLGGYINILIAIGHVVGLIWADDLFKTTRVEKEMNELAQTHSSLPYLLTIFVSIVFLIFGLYGLSADKKFIKLPFLKFGVFGIAGIYIFRGLVALILDMTRQRATPLTETVYSLIALTIGLLFLIGGIKQWNLK